jgi:hypothetical protein
MVISSLHVHIFSDPKKPCLSLLLIKIFGTAPFSERKWERELWRGATTDSGGIYYQFVQAFPCFAELKYKSMHAMKHKLKSSPSQFDDPGIH